MHSPFGWSPAGSTHRAAQGAGSASGVQVAPTIAPRPDDLKLQHLLLPVTQEVGS